MATTFTVQDCYQTVCWVLLEDSGLALGLITPQNFLDLFADVFLDFMNRTGLVQEIFTQQLNLNVSTYQSPLDVTGINECFIGGIAIDHTTLQDLDDWRYNWRSVLDIPQWWHEDGLPPSTIEVAANPNYNGAGYRIPVDPTLQPPFGVYGVFNAAPAVMSTGIVSVSSVYDGGGAWISSTVQWLAGDVFNTGWASYYPVLNINIGGVLFPIYTVPDTTSMTLAMDGGTLGATVYSITPGDDGNLTMVGPKGTTTNVFTLGQTVPVIPDSFCYALAYGVLARIFTQDGEAKDLSRAQYAQARYTEYLNAAAAVSGQVLEGQP